MKNTDSSGASSAISPAAGAAKKFSHKIVLIEDDLDIQDVIEGFFRPRGFEVLKYDDPELALADLNQAKVTADVILTDLMLPNMTGIEFTQRSKAAGIHIPIILMTAHKAAETAVEAITAGAYDFIVKPLHFPQLHVSVERALHFSRINRENLNLKAAVKAKEGSMLDGVIGRSPGFLKALDLAKRVSNSAASIFISGESGTGKEVIARAIHSFGTRKKGPFVAINCSAIPENLLEAELFGYAKGAFTGATDKKIGLFEEAEGGTLFLDEIGDLSLPLQAKLLRVLQERRIKRVGENQTRAIDVRVVSATHKNLTQEVLENRFREDLFFRLNVIPIALPPLRERKEDILPLAEFFLRKFAALNDSKVNGFSKAALECLLSQVWRGNVRELENTIERAVVLCAGDQIDEADLFDIAIAPLGTTGLASSDAAVGRGASDLPLPLGADGQLLTIEELIQMYVKFALIKNGGAKDRTARELGIDRKTLYRRVQELERTSGGETAQNILQ
jgi:two-component system response regulator HydG